MKIYLAQAIQVQPRALAEKAIRGGDDAAAIEAARAWARAMRLERLVVRQARRLVFRGER